MKPMDAASTFNTLSIKPLEPENADQLLDYLGGLDFGHAPHWSTCFCQFYQTNCEMGEWKARSGETNRAEAQERIQKGLMQGYVATLGDKVVGWLNANDAMAFPRLKDSLAPYVAGGRWGVPICYVIHPEHRGKGVAKALLQRAISDFRARGFDGVIALPIAGDNMDPQLLYRGAQKMYENLGFDLIESRGDMRLMKRTFALDPGLLCFTLDIPQLKRQRTVRVWLPPGYAEGNTRYPVLYMHDGQNLFDRETAAYGAIWDAHLAIEALMKAHPERFQGAIVVGVDNAEGLQRLDEYSPWESSSAQILKDLGPHAGRIGGEGEAYGQFVVETLKPWVDSQFRTLTGREFTFVAGSSMGGVISLYMGARYPEVFSGVGAFSTAAWFAQDELVACLEGAGSLGGEGASAKDLRWYLDVGTEETSNSEIPNFNQLYVDGTLACSEALKRAGVNEDQLQTLVVENAIHNERDWSKRLPEALAWLLRLR